MNGIYNNFYLSAKVKFKKGDQIIHGIIKSIQLIQKCHCSQIYYRVVGLTNNESYLVPQYDLLSEYEEIKK